MPFDSTIVLQACEKWRTKRLKRLPRGQLEPVVWYADKQMHTWHPAYQRVVSQPGNAQTASAPGFAAQAEVVVTLALPLVRNLIDQLQVPEGWFADYPDIVQKDAQGDWSAFEPDPGDTEA